MYVYTYNSRIQIQSLWYLYAIYRRQYIRFCDFVYTKLQLCLYKVVKTYIRLIKNTPTILDSRSIFVQSYITCLTFASWIPTLTSISFWDMLSYCNSNQFVMVYIWDNPKLTLKRPLPGEFNFRQQGSPKSENVHFCLTKFHILP